MTGEIQLSAARERMLRYWSANMRVAFTESNGAPWLGFGYGEGEKVRMRALAASLPGRAVSIFFTVTVIAYILMAALGIIGFLIPVLTLAYPDPSKTPSLVFVVALAMVAFSCLGFGLPLSMAVAARAGDAFGGGRPAPAASGDAALAVKISWQLWRMTWIMVGVFIPGCMLFILFDLQAGPFVTALKVACGAVCLLSLLSTLRGRKT